jgi:hypothetical protein
MPPDTPARACAHPSARSKIEMSQEPGDDANRYTVTLRISCAVCEAPMRFTGLQQGHARGAARVTADGLEARLPVEIAEEKTLRCPDCGKILTQPGLADPKVPVTIECGPVHRLELKGTWFLVLPDGSWTLDNEPPSEGGDLTIARQRADVAEGDVILREATDLEQLAALRERMDPDEAAARLQAAREREKK